MPRLLMAVTLAVACAVPTARADERSSYRQLIAQQKAQQEGYIKRMEALPGPRKIEDLIRVTNEKGVLTLKSSLFASAEQMKNRQFRAEVEGFDGFCTVMVQPINAQTYYFTFQHMSYPNLDGMTNLSVTMQPGLLQIARNYNARTRNFNVTLVQTFGRGQFGQPDGVHFSVYGSDNTGKVSVSFSVSEEDFASLRREHPREVDQYLRPVLRELKLETLFAVDETMAWQVFADDWPGNTAVAAQVRALLPRLERNSYAQREAARQELRKLGPQGALVIYNMSRDGLSAEQNGQLDAVLSGSSFLSRAEARRLLTDTDFLLDCLYTEDAGIRAAAARHLQETLKRDGPLEMPDDYAARVAKLDALRGEIRAGAGSAAKKAGPE